MKQIIKNYIKYIGKLYSYVYPNKINKCINTLKNNLYTGYIQKNFAHFGNSVIMLDVTPILQQSMRLGLGKMY